jgi:DNA mismatch endonuclease (patch repair protein)
MSRGQVMSRIRSKRTKLEKRFCEVTLGAGIRTRRADALPGKPDFRVTGTRVLIFVNSCFWHGCAEHCRMPSSRHEYWVPKIAGNVERQRQVMRDLRRRGYRPVVVWEHALIKQPRLVLNQLMRNINRDLGFALDDS